MKKLEKKEILGFEKSELTDNALQSVFGGETGGTQTKTFSSLRLGEEKNDGCDDCSSYS